MAFDIIALKQGTPAWLAWRQGGIGASEADAILGRNRWRTAAAVLREKVAPPVAGGFTNAAMVRGTALEPEARALYRRHTGHKVEPACLQSRQHDWLRASVDGICVKAEKLVEIKCGEKVYDHTARHGQPPDYYQGQLQHILAVTGYEAIDFWCYLPDRPPLLVPVKRDPAFIQALVIAEAKVWQQVQDSRLAAART